MGQNLWGWGCAILLALAWAPSVTGQQPNGDVAKNVESASDRLVTVSAERRIEGILRKQLKAPLDFPQTPLIQVTQVLSEDYDIPIIFDTAALDAVAVSPEVEVSIQIDNTTLGSALDLILSRNGELTYTIDKEVLLITTHEEAERRLDTRVYRVDDLTDSNESYGAWSQEGDVVDSLIDIIIASVEQDTWAENGTGEGEIRPFPPAMLVISQTRRVHGQIERLFDDLRRTKAEVLASAPAADDQAVRTPVTARIDIVDKTLAESEESRQAVREALLASVDWQPEGSETADEDLFLHVLPNRVIVRHVPQVIGQVKRVVRDISVERGGYFCGDAAAKKPEVAEDSQGGDDGE